MTATRPFTTHVLLRLCWRTPWSRGQDQGLHGRDRCLRGVNLPRTRPLGTFAMGSIDVNPSNNGRGSEAWFRSWTHFSIDRRSPGHCLVTFDHPPINTVTATTVAELAELVDLIEEDRD